MGESEFSRGKSPARLSLDPISGMYEATCTRNCTAGCSVEPSIFARGFDDIRCPEVQHPALEASCGAGRGTNRWKWGDASTDDEQDGVIIDDERDMSDAEVVNTMNTRDANVSNTDIDVTSMTDAEKQIIMDIRNAYDRRLQNAAREQIPGASQAHRRRRDAVIKVAHFMESDGQLNHILVGIIRRYIQHQRLLNVPPSQF